MIYYILFKQQCARLTQVEVCYCYYYDYYYDKKLKAIVLRIVFYSTNTLFVARRMQTNNSAIRFITLLMNYSAVSGRSIYQGIYLFPWRKRQGLCSKD